MKLTFITFVRTPDVPIWFFFAHRRNMQFCFTWDAACCQVHKTIANRKTNLSQRRNKKSRITAKIPQEGALMGHTRQGILVSSVFTEQHSGCLQLLQVKADNRHEKKKKNLHENKTSTVLYTRAQSYGVSTQQPSVLLLWSLMGLLHQHGHLCSVEQCGTPCRQTCAWSMELWLGVIQLPEELACTSCSSLPKLWIITLSVCQHLSGPQEEPVTHSCLIPVTLSHLQGAPVSLKAMFTIPFVSCSKEKATW